MSHSLYLQGFDQHIEMGISTPHRLVYIVSLTMILARALGIKE